MAFRSICIFSGAANLPLAREICQYLELPLGVAKITTFADGEIFVEINDNNAKLLRIDQQTTDKPIRCNLDKLTYVAHELVAASDNIPTWNGREVRYVTSGFELDQIPGSERDRRTRARARLEQ